MSETHARVRSTTVLILMLLALLGGVTLVAYARWTTPIAEADRAVQNQQFQQALDHYVQAEARFDSLAPAKELFAGEYDRVVANQLWLQYQLQEYDPVIEKADRAPAGAQPHFWAGCVFFQKAVAAEEPPARLTWLTRSEAEFRKAIEESPDDWDTKYNYELVTRLAAELRKQPKAPPKQLMELLRPEKKERQPVKRIG